MLAMNLLCLALAVAFTLLLGFVSYIQLLYLESLRLLRPEVPSLEYFRESLAERIGLEAEHGSLTFSLIKHLSLPLAGLFYLCALVRPGVAPWQSVLEAVGLSLIAMLLTTYLVPMFLYRRTKGAWMLRFLPAIKLMALCASPLTALLRMFQSLLELDKYGTGETAPADSVEHIEALRDDDRMEINVAMGQTAVDLGRIGVVLKEVFAGFQRRMPVKRVPQHKDVGVAYYAGGFQFMSDAARGISRAEQDKLLSTWRDGQP